VDPGLSPARHRTWPRFTLRFRYHSARYVIEVENPKGVPRGVETIELDSRPLPGPEVPLADDGLEHRVRVVMG
jgi:hypothetical protein